MFSRYAELKIWSSVKKKKVREPFIDPKDGKKWENSDDSSEKYWVNNLFLWIRPGQERATLYADMLFTKRYTRVLGSESMVPGVVLPPCCALTAEQWTTKFFDFLKHKVQPEGAFPPGLGLPFSMYSSLQKF